MRGWTGNTTGHAALATRHGYNAFNAGHAVLTGPRAGTGGRSGRGGGLLDLDMNVRHPGQRFQDPFTVRLDLLASFGIGGRELHGNTDRTLIGRDLLDQPKGNDVPRIAGIFYGLEGVENIFFGEFAHERA